MRLDVCVAAAAVVISTLGVQLSLCYIDVFSKYDETFVYARGFSGESEIS